MSSERRLLVPLTCSPERVMSTICALADEDTSVTAVVVIEVSPLLPLDARMDEEEAAARTLLARAQTVADSCGVAFVPQIVRARKAAAAIIELATQADAEIVVGSAGHLRRPERQLVRKAPDRVLVVAA